MIRFALFVLLIGFAILAPAQTAEEETTAEPIGGLAFVDQFELTIVNIAAYVRDKKGNPVGNLSREDFRILQDGEEKEITNFQIYERAAAEAAPMADPEALPVTTPVPDTAPETQPLNLVLYLDNKNLHPLDRNRVLRDIRSFVLDNLQPPNRMMVVTYLSELRILQHFTSDPSAILESLREVRTWSGGRPQRDSTRQDILDRMWQEAEATTDPTGYNVQRTASYNDMLNYADEETHELIVSLDALRQVVQLLIGVPGRKAVVYISNGIPMVPGLDLFNVYAALIHNPTVLSEIQRYDRSSAFQSLVDWANSQDVSLYTIGAQGLEIPGMATTGQRSRGAPVAPPTTMDTHLDALRYMANETGGLAIVKTNDFSEGFERIEQDLYSYYSLGYPLTQSGTDRVHNIEVTLPGHPDLELRFRNRFVEKSLETQVQERVLANLLHDIDDNPMDLVIKMGSPSMSTGKRWSVPVHVSFPIGRVALLPEGEERVGRVVLFVAAREASGKSSEAVREPYEIRLPANSAEAMLDSPFNLSTSLLMEPGTYRIALGLMDEVTRQASYQNVTINLSPR